MTNIPFLTLVSFIIQLMSTTTLRLYQIHGTDKAYCFSRLPKKDAKNSQGIWIPRSVITHISRMPAGVNEWPECGVTIEDWFIDKTPELQ